MSKKKNYQEWLDRENPVPKSLIDGLISHANAYDDHDLPDGAWWAILEEQCQDFMRMHKIKGSPFEAVHQLLRCREDNTAK